jgi:adenosylmethionine-8-amino-7-oxononanoate aminotransferase
MIEVASEPTRADIGGTQDIFYADPAAVPLPMMDRAEGVFMWDEAGKEYMDASSGPMVSALGHGNKQVIGAMAAQAGKLDYAYSRVARNRPNLALADRLAGLAGPGFERVGFASGGSEVVDNALKFLRQHAVATGQASRRRIISLMPSYHGATIGTLAIGGNEGLALFMDGFADTADTIPAPFSYRRPADKSIDDHAFDCAAALDHKINELGSENVLAFVVEPVGGISTGAVVPPHAWFRQVRDICTRHGVFLVFDEILCGAGRSGKYITAHHWPDALPDIIVMAKGLAAGYSPLGAMLAPAVMVDKLAALTGCEFSYSYNANPVSCATGMAVLDEFDRQDLVNRAGTTGAKLRAGLEEIMDRSPLIGDVRGMGMLLAVEIVADKATKKMLPDATRPGERIRVHGLDNGIMLYTRPTSGSLYGHWFMVSPPLNITEDECDEILRRTEASVGAFYKELQSSCVV